MTSFLSPVPPFNRAFYEELRGARSRFTQVEKFIISLEERGKAFVVKSGQSVRIVCVEGPQIADVCLWNANDPRERLWDDQTMNREGFFLTTFNRLWSNMPKFRPMMTIIEDTVETKPTYPYAQHHYIFGSHCNPHYWYWALRDKNHPYVTTYNCHYNFIRAIAPFGLKEEDVHDNLNLFMKCHFDLETGLHPVEPSDAKKGDYVEFYAEMDVLMAVSVCPNGSGTLPSTVGEQDIKPLGIEIYDTGVQPLPFENVFNTPVSV